MSTNAEITTTSVPSTPAANALPVNTPDEAVEKCMRAYKRAYDACAAKGEAVFKCRDGGAFAFRVAMPSPGTLAEVQAFIACVTRGIHLDIWKHREPQQFFSAARIALSALKRENAK